MEQVILVDDQDNPIGLMEKLEVHEKAILHRAFSVFIFNHQGELLLQQRALSKYHSAGLWTNTCCSHPRPDETTKAAANRRLLEEMGFETSLEKVFDFIYLANFDNGLTEHEFDHVFIGFYEGTILPNNAEVNSFKYISIEEIDTQLINTPDIYTEWFKIAYPKVKAWWDLQKTAS
ncbi:MAG: isopentenyl-diphosphate Delta-isomerase [Sphingobacteriia bacterium]|jgi:isopentenyl-diphosphate delta-isomerase